MSDSWIYVIYHCDYDEEPIPVGYTKSIGEALQKLEQLENERTCKTCVGWYGMMKISPLDKNN